MQGQCGSCPVNMDQPAVSVYVNQGQGQIAWGHYCNAVCAQEQMAPFTQQMPKPNAPMPTPAPHFTAPPENLIVTTEGQIPVVNDPWQPAEDVWGIQEEIPAQEIAQAPLLDHPKFVAQPNIVAGVWQAVGENPLEKASNFVVLTIEKLKKYGFEVEPHPIEINVNGQTYPGNIWRLFTPKMTIVIRYDADEVLLDLGGPNNVAVNLHEIKDAQEGVDYIVEHLMATFKIPLKTTEADKKDLEVLMTHFHENMKAITDPQIVEALGFAQPVGPGDYVEDKF
jgi:hypothetical protein